MELCGKIIHFLGDSITEGVGVAQMENRYDRRLLRHCELKEAYNYGISGTRFAHQRRATECPRFDLSFCGRAYDMAANADVIVVFGATNDYGHGDAPFGTAADSTPDTFCGAVEFLMNLLQTLYPQARVVFLTPAHRLGDGAPSQDPCKLPDAKPLAAYARVIREKGREKGIAVLDLMENLGIDPNDPQDFQTYTTDGLHLNDAGHERLAQCLEAFLKTL